MTAIAEVATRNSPGSIPASCDTVESEGRSDEAVLNKIHKKIQKNTPVKRVSIRALYACKGGGYIIYKENIHKGHQQDLDYVDCHRPEISQVYTPNESQLYI